MVIGKKKLLVIKRVDVIGAVMQIDVFLDTKNLSLSYVESNKIGRENPIPVKKLDSYSPDFRKTIEGVIEKFKEFLKEKNKKLKKENN